MRAQYKHNAMRHLRDVQLQRHPDAQRLRQASLIERLLSEIRPDESYSFDFLHRELVGSEPERHAGEEFSAEDVRHDLCLIVEDLSDAANITASAAGQRVLTVEELAQALTVSVKTIARGRRLGLVSRRFVFDGQKRLGFLESSVRQFVRRNPEKVRRGARFSQLSRDEELEIIDRARQMALTGGCPGKVARDLAENTGRSVETVRQLIKQHDRERPEAAVFPDHLGEIRLETKQAMYRMHRDGASLARISRRYCQSRRRVRAAIAEMDLRRVLDLPLDFIPNEAFEKVQSKADERALLAPPEPSSKPRVAKRPSGLPAYLASMYQVPLLSPEEERHLFCKMNYLKYRASKLRNKLDQNRPDPRLIARIDRLHDRAAAVKNRIVRANLRLVVSVAKQHVTATTSFFELVSDGNMSLMRAVDKFDFARGFRFSTYATWALRKNFARSVPTELKRRERFSTATDQNVFEAAIDDRPDHFREERLQNERQSRVQEMLEQLDRRERDIIIRHYGLDRDREPMTLKQIGKELGVSKERVRQLETRALEKLRKGGVAESLEPLLATA